MKQRPRWLRRFALAGAICLTSGSVFTSSARAATFVVDSVADTNDGLCGGPFGDCTLREAITNANSNTGADTIQFSIAGTGVRTIVLTSALPFISDAVFIDGFTQGGAGYSGPPLIELNGANAPSTANGLTVQAASVTIRGLAINRFGGNGIRLANGGGAIVVGNYIGTNATGAAALANSGDGILVESGSNTIGGTSTSARNVISGNTGNGIRLSGNTTATVVEGNYIGLNSAGTVTIRNNLNGVRIENVAGLVTIGGTATSARNVISGNSLAGVSLNNCDNARVQGNYLGTNAAGTLDRGNLQEGVDVTSSANAIIGGSVSGAGNLISGNTGSGVILNSSQSCRVEANFIGTTADGTAAIPNDENGVFVLNSNNCTIGGNSAPRRNVISGNTQAGVLISGTTSSANIVQGNFIGTNATGAGAVANGASGVALFNAPGNTIGGAAPAATNVISGNVGHGVALDGGSSTTNLVQGNRIGTDATGTVALANSQNGINVNAPQNTIGGTSATLGNLISGNAGNGVQLTNLGVNTVIQSNQIGTDAAGTLDLGNTLNGILISGSGNTIGGTVSGTGNLISGNDLRGVSVIGGALNNAVLRNRILANTFLGIDLQGDGVTPNDVGDGDSGPNNVQNFPVLTSVAGGSGNTTVGGTLNSAASTTFRVEFFDNATADLTGFGEGQTFLGFANITTNASGDASYSLVLPHIGAGDVVTATATDPNGNTSEFSAAVGVHLASAFSRKTHGSTTFDLPLSLTGLAAVESRSGGATGDHQLVLLFPAPVTVNGIPQAQVNGGAGSVGTGGVSNGGAVSISGNTVTVPVTNVADAQKITVTLFGVSDGINTNNISVVVGVLFGDASGDGTVNSADVTVTRNHSGQDADTTNFRSDYNLDGFINAADVTIVRGRSGNFIP